MEIPPSLQHDSLAHATEVFSRAFIHDTFQNYLLRTHLDLKGSDQEITVEQNTELFSVILRGFQQGGKALFVTASDARSVASVWVLETPSCHDEDEGADGGMPVRVAELNGLSRPIWEREFPDGRQVLHLVLVGNAGSAIREGGQKGASYVIREMIGAASRAGIPVILEATSPKARDIYERCGFEAVGEVVVGEGNANAEGRLESGGVGFSVTLMKYFEQE